MPFILLLLRNTSGIDNYSHQKYLVLPLCCPRHTHRVGGTYSPKSTLWSKLETLWNSTQYHRNSKSSLLTLRFLDSPNEFQGNVLLSPRLPGSRETGTTPLSPPPPVLGPELRPQETLVEKVGVFYITMEPRPSFIW